MPHDTKKQRYDKRLTHETSISNFNQSIQNGNPQSTSQNGSNQIVSYYSNGQMKIQQAQSNKSSINQHLYQKDIQSDHLIDIKKLNQIDQQEREIEKVAQELITLKEIVKKLKVSIGILVQQQINHSYVHYFNDADSSQYQDTEVPIVKAMQKLQKIQDRRITPEYREWISQYFNKIFNDVKQIKTQFLNYQKAKRKSQNLFDINQQKINLDFEKPYENLIEYQIKCRLLQCVLKLCKYKGIFSNADHIKYLNQLTVVSNQVLVENLQKYRMNNMCQKVKALKKSGPQELFYQWKTIHDELQIVNLQQIQRFYKQKKQISYHNNYENNQNGILIIGGSGVGKTTLFLSMAGQKMIKKKIKSRNCQFENYQAADQQIANQYKTSPFSTSCTRQPAKLQAPKKYTFPQQLCLIDTAGFQQSRSGEIDIMNTLYTFQTIQQMKKLRIIIVISEKNIGQRDQGLNKFAKNIARYFRDYQEVRQSILFVLTKFDNVKKLKIACDNILKASISHKDTNEYRFIKHLQQSIVYKECIQFRPTDENIVFDAEYHIDPVQMDGKLKKLYKSLLKRFPIHHEYENDYINLQYSRQTKDKLIMKKCYLENMIRKLYKQGNNNFRFYLEQLMFLQNKVNKIDNKNHQKYVNDQQNTFDILTFIDQINQEVITKFTSLIQEYFTQCNPQTLKSILQLKNRYSKLFLGNLQAMIQNTEEDYQYIFQQITQSINGLKLQFDKIVDEKQKQISKMMKYKAKVCHDIKNKKWLCAVMNFTKQYFNQSSTEQQKNLSQQKQGKNSRTSKKHKKEQHYNKQYKALLKTLKKNEQKLKQQFSDELHIMDQQISNYLMKKTSTAEGNTSNDFLVQTEKQMFEAYNNFKKLLFHSQMFQTKNGQTTIQIPSDQKVLNSNLQYIISILKENLDKQFDQICQNIQLMNMMNHNLKESDPDISRNVFQQVERYSQKIKMYYACDKPIYELMQSFYNRVMKKVNFILKQINDQMFSITKRQSEDQIRVVQIIQNANNVNLLPQYKKLNLKRLQRLNSNILYCYLSKINEIDEFPELRKQMEFQVRCFNLKLRDYGKNLEKYLQKYDQKLSMFKNIIKHEKVAGKSSLSLQLYTSIKAYIEQCIQIQHQIKLIHHYFRNQQSKQNSFKFEHLSYIKSIFYRHSRFLQSEKKCIRNSYELTELSQSNQIAYELIIDYMILEEIYIQKIKYDDSHEFKKLHNAYQNSFQSKIEFINEFQQMKTHQLKMLNQCKHRILDKLIEYPLQMESFQLDKIETQEFQSTFQPKSIKKTVNIFVYYIKLKQIFQDIQILNNEEVTHDFRVIQLSDISTPLQNIQQNIVTLSNLVATITQIGTLKYIQLKQSLSQIILDDEIKIQVINYLKGTHHLCMLFDKLEKSSLQGLQILQDSLQSFKRKNLFDQIKQFVDKCQSIFYRLSKNIDSIQLQHLQNMSQILDKPQSNKQFLKLLKSQCVFFVDALQHSDFNNLQSESLSSLKDLLKKMEESQNQMDFVWEQEMKELQKSSKDPKNSLHKLIKLYEHHISKVSTQKTLEYRFVQLKKQQLGNEIKQFLADPTQNKVQKGQALCQQLKNYLNFLKSMKLKMVVNLNGIDEIKNIEEMQRIYEKQATKSQAQKSESNMTPSQIRQNFLSVDYGQLKRQNSERYSVSDIKTSNFVNGTNEKHIQRKSAMRKSQQWDQRSNDTNQTPKKVQHIEESFSGVVDNWSKQMAFNTMDNKNKKIELAKSQSQLEIRGKPDMRASTPLLQPSQSQYIQMTRSSIDVSTNPTLNIGRSGIDHAKRYTINTISSIPQQVNSSISMKKSSINVKNAPPVLTYQNSSKSIKQNNNLLQSESKINPPVTQSVNFVRQNSNLIQPNSSYSKLQKNESKLQVSSSNQSFHTNLNGPSRVVSSKPKTQQKINY